MYARAPLMSVVVAGLLALMAAMPVRATVHNISVSDFQFSPQGTVISPGDTVRWTLVNGVHTTTSDASSPKQWDSGLLDVDEPFDVLFTAADGPGPFPYHCAMHPASMMDTIFVETASPYQNIADYVRDNILGGNNDSVTMWMTDTWLDPSHVVRDVDPGIDDIPFPYSRTWLVMVDLMPEANFGHPVRWVFVDDDLSQHVDLGIRNHPPSVLTVSAELLAFFCREVTPWDCPNYGVPPGQGNNGNNDQDCLHAVLISGGWNDWLNYSRYAENLTSMYNLLREAGYPKANIWVYYTDGTDPLDLDNADSDNNHNTGSDVTAGVFQWTIRARIDTLCDSLDQDDDILFVYTTGHGAYSEGSMLWDWDHDGNFDENEIYSPAELGTDTDNCKVCRLFMLHDQCYSGAFVPIATDGYHSNTAVYAASEADDVSWGREYLDIWEDMDPCTTTVNDMHDVVVAQGISSIPVTAEGTVGVGDNSLCDCCETCASGDCNSTYYATFLAGTQTGTWSLSVEFQPPDPIAPGVRRASVNRFVLRDEELGLYLSSLPGSQFFLISQQPTGDPFFPANLSGNLFVQASLPEFGLLLQNTEAMIVESPGSYNQWPPPVGAEMNLFSVGPTHLVSQGARANDTLTIISSVAILVNHQLGGGCCVGIRGNMDGDDGEAIDISDLVYVVDYMFNGGPPPPCFEESDVDASGGSSIDIADLVYLVDYMFTGGPPPDPCP